jgi:hypothetical protein
VNKGFIFCFSEARTPTAAFNHRPKNLLNVILASGDGDEGEDAVGDGGGNELVPVAMEMMVNVVEMDNTQISHNPRDNDASDDENDSDWEPPPNPTPEHGGPSAAPVDPAAVVARFREQVRETLTTRGRADKRGIRSLLLFSTSTSSLCFGSKFMNVEIQNLEIRRFENCISSNSKKTSKSFFLGAVLRIQNVYPGSWILIFTHLGSRIPDPGSKNSNKREG